jgi:hypothetical protein
MAQGNPSRGPQAQNPKPPVPKVNNVQIKIPETLFAQMIGGGKQGGQGGPPPGPGQPPGNPQQLQQALSALRARQQMPAA